MVEDETWDWFKGFAEDYQIKGYRNHFNVQETLTVIRQILEQARA